MSAADAAQPYEPRIHRGVVTGARRLGPGMVRICLGGADMHDYPTTGVGDEYVRLFFPDRPDEAVRLPFVSERGWDFAEGVEPSQMRTYTIRDHRPGEVDIDFVDHTGGIAAEWASQACPGQELGINPPRPLYERPAWARRQILVADEPGLPAALRLAELTSQDVETLLIAEVRGEAHQVEARTEGVDYVWLRGTGNGRGPSGLVAALRRAQIDDRTHVWVAGETRLTRDARAFLRHELGLPRDAYKCVGYWTDRAEQWQARYEEMGEAFHRQVASLYASDRDSEEIADEVQRIYEAAGL